MSEHEAIPKRPRWSPALLRGAGWWQGAAAVGVILVLSVTVVLMYVTAPQSPRDLLDQLSLLVDEDAYGPNLGRGERLLERAGQAETAEMDSVAEGFEWKAADAFARASAGAAGPREEMAANDRLVDVYLELGRRHLERGRGGRLGIGRHPEELGLAEDVAACVVGVAPTGRRADVNAYLEVLESVLERPLEGRCPR
jgi:hypothetical protein